MKVLRQFAFGTIAMLIVMSWAAKSFAADPPSRVARLNYISGQVSMQPGGVNDWAAATINRPMTTADRLWTDKDSRAELHLGSAALRMDSETSLTLTNLSDNTVQLELDEGVLNLQVARMFNGEIYEVDTPNAAFTVLKPGDYRFDVDSHGDTTLITVWRGKGVATGDGQAVRVESHHQARFMGGMSLQHAMYKAPRPDGFDEWCQVRAERESRAVSVRYVSPDVVGYEDLDEYGYWREVPSYGAVWFPTRVEVGWAPYRNGHWAWIEPWGWTWVDDAPWGFAPFHYGRWVSVTGAWAWVPGPVNVRPCYAPALVAWVGSSGAGIGWFPLGYGEPYIPSYHVSRNYFQTVNVSNTRITNITYVTNNYYNVENVRITNIHYVNQTNAITVVNNDVLVNSRRVDRDVFIDRDRDWHDHHDAWVTAGPPVAPSHRAVLGIHSDRGAPEPPAQILNRRVVVNVKPPERPVPFDDKRANIEDHHGRPLDNTEEDQLRRRIPAQARPDPSNYGNRQAQAPPDRWHGSQASDDHRSDSRDQRNSVTDEQRDYSSHVHRPPQRGADDRGQPAATGGNYPDPRPRGQNPDGDDNRQQHTDSADNAPYRNPNSNRQPDDFGGRQFPHPPNHGESDHGQQAVSRGNSPDPRQRGENPNGNNGEGQRADSADNSQYRNPNSNRQQPDSASARGEFSHPPQVGPDRNAAMPPQQGEGTSNADRSGRNAPQQPVQAMESLHDRRPNPGIDRQVPQPPYTSHSVGSDPAQPAVHQATQQPEREFNAPRPPMQQAQPTDGRRDNSGADRDVPHPSYQAPHPSYNDRGSPAAPPQQVERSMPRPPQVDHDDSRPPAPVQRASEPPRSAPTESHGSTNNSGSNGNSHAAAQYQERDHGKPQDH
ncbi:MAG TPA: DUF6600 domain-containing protein [Terriglobales bacterium]|nr:DUF6600 domain-containing protein [Terriglobales bacterium]